MRKLRLGGAAWGVVQLIYGGEGGGGGVHGITYAVILGQGPQKATQGAEVPLQCMWPVNGAVDLILKLENPEWVSSGGVTGHSPFLLGLFSQAPHTCGLQNKHSLCTSIC